MEGMRIENKFRSVRRLAGVELKAWIEHMEIGKYDGVLVDRILYVS